VILVWLVERLSFENVAMIAPARVLTALLLGMPLLLAAPPTFALVTVGPKSGGCRFQKLQDAINYVLAYERNGFGTGTPSFDDPFIAVTGGTYVEELSLDGTGISDPRPGQQGQGALVYILGGYNPATCDNPRDPSFAVTLNSGGRSGASTLKISGNSRVYLDMVTVTGANGGNGGGFAFTGSGLLDLTNVAVVENNAVNGAGVYANGQAPGIDIVLHHDTLFEFNTAAFSGGAFRLEGISHLVAAEDQTLFYGNSAGTTGGALSLSGYQAAADIGSAGYGGLPVIYDNSAELGGGVSATAAATLRLWRTAGRGRTGIVFNHATTFGGGVYLNGISNQRFSKMCAFGFRIDGNTAPDGAAVYGDAGSTIGMNEDDFEFDYGLGICGAEAPLPSAADISCVPDAAACNSVSGNTASAGAVVVSYGLTGELVEFRSNSAARALQGGIILTNCVVANNTLTQDVANRLGLYLTNCTLAGNSLGAQSPVISGTGAGELLESIVWQPNNHTFDPASSLSNAYLRNLITSDANLLSSAGLFQNVHAYDPTFVALAQGDFHLKPGSPAIDYAVFDITSSPDDDIEGNSRPVALRHAATPIDIGAYELQSLGDMIYMATFDHP
jgi:hypothetical protein